MATTRFSHIVATIAATGLLANTASAGDRHRTVEYSDLDLSTTAGQATLKKRVNSAVSSVCSFPNARTSAERADEQRCTTRARTVAMRQAAQKIARHGGNVKVAID
jgi:UrcA family protein